MKNWTHKAVKMQRGSAGEWFSYPAATTGTEEECRACAERFAAEQTAAGVVGTRIVLLTRGGKFVAEYRVGAR